MSGVNGIQVTEGRLHMGSQNNTLSWLSIFTRGEGQGDSLWSISWSREWQRVPLLISPAVAHMSTGGLDTVLVVGCRLSGCGESGFSQVAFYRVWGYRHSCAVVRGPRTSTKWLQVSEYILPVALTLSLLQHTHPPYWHRWWKKKFTKTSFLTLMYGHNILRISFLTFYFYFSFFGLFFHSS